MLLFIALAFHAQSAFADPIQIDTGVKFKSDVKKSTIKIKGFKQTKPDGSMIEIAEMTIKQKNKTKSGNGKLKGSLDTGTKSGSVSLNSAVSGKISADIDILLADGTSVSRSFDELPFAETFNANLTFDNGIVTTFGFSGTGNIPSFVFPEIGFETGIASIGYSDPARIIALLIDPLFPFQTGSTIDITFETNLVWNFEHIPGPIVFTETSTNAITAVSEPPTGLLIISLGMVSIVLGRRRAWQREVKSSSAARG